MDNNICQKCGCSYIVTSIGFKSLCMCNEPERYKQLDEMFKILWEEEKNCSGCNYYENSECISMELCIDGSLNNEKEKI